MIRKYFSTADTTFKHRIGSDITLSDLLFHSDHILYGLNEFEGRTGTKPMQKYCIKCKFCNTKLAFVDMREKATTSCGDWRFVRR